MEIANGLRLDGDEVRRRYDLFEKNSEHIRWDKQCDRSVPWEKLDKKEVSLEELTVVKLVLYVESYADVYANFLIEEFCPDKVFERFTRLWQREEQNHADQLKHYLTEIGLDPEKITKDLLEPRNHPFTIGYIKNPIQATAYTYIQELLTAFFYGEFAKKVKEPALKVLLSRIIADEWRHFHWYEELLQSYRKANPALTYSEITPIFQNFQMPGRTILGPAYDAITEEIAKFMGFGFEAVKDLGARIIATFGTWDGGRLLLKSQYVKDYKAFFKKPMETDESKAIFSGFQEDIRLALVPA
jgi:rubrerythrin